MPILKSAKKSLRQDRHRTIINKPVKTRANVEVAAARKNPTSQTLAQAFAALDKAAKHHVIKKGKANRLKQRLAKLLAKVANSPAESKSATTPKTKKTTIKRKRTTKVKA